MRQQRQTITFRSAAEMLDVFGMQQGGSQYRRLIAAFQRVFGATIFFGTDTQTAKAAVTHQARFNFMREARICYSRDPNQELLPGGFENVIVLSDEFYREVTAHSIPTDLKRRKRSRLPRQHWTYICGCRIAASQPGGKNGSRSLANSVWSHNSGVSSTPGRASFASG
jgi:Replication initiator protein A